MSSLFEAFNVLNTLEEEAFDISTNGNLEEISEFEEENEDTKEMETIIDPLAETDEDLKDSYLGKAILNCVICQSKIYTDPNEIVVDEGGDLVNVGEECPYCQSVDGYKVIGQVAKYQPVEEEQPKDIVSDEENPEDESMPNEEIPAEVEEVAEDEEIEEGIKTKKGLAKHNSLKEENIEENKESNYEKLMKVIDEDFNKVDIETDKEKMTVESDDNGKVTVTTEPKTEAPVEMQAVISNEPEAPVVETPVEETTAEPEYQDIDFDEIDEEGFDKLGESYMKKVYENVESFKTTSGTINKNELKLEGLITFKSGKQAKTNFIFEAKTATKSGKLKFIGENKQFAKGKKSFTLTGKVDGKKLVTESLNYNYRAKDTKSGVSKRLYGTVTR